MKPQFFNFNGGLITGNQGGDGCGITITSNDEIVNINFNGGEVTENYATRVDDFNENSAPYKVNIKLKIKK